MAQGHDFGLSQLPPQRRTAERGTRERANVDRVEYVCAVCNEPIEPDDRAKIRVEGVTHSSSPKAWI